ncbi:uncharacterized protein F4822DRAFT_394736 [Hypoxylon trugodes]|uniref:uncharacterized protein n=1 Tax=Hypoxylon trugodes TaxID=326681 RepID=UPI00218D451F|nr:uncharacterized protein F4822DRAFT_394736 [Hypoxylon trugodes]KAI1390887.1 hypothetical protein F4822DRAFT_394736 [Hypoxylon trugodes]
MSSSTPITIQAAEGVGITLIVLATALVSARCFTNYSATNGKLTTDDYTSIVGLCFLIATFAVNDVLTRILTGPVESIDLVYLQKLSVVIIILVQATLWFSKAPILFLYLKLFGIHRWLRYISWLTLLISAMVYIAGLIFTLVRCPIDPSNATFPAYQVCAHSNTLTGVISGFVSVVVDGIMFSLPIPIIIGLNLKLSKKIGLGLTFFSGILGIVASVVALYYKWQALYGNGTQFIVPVFCFTIEGAVAILVGCAPAVKTFWSRYVSRSKADKSQGSASSYSFRGGSSSYKAGRVPRSTTWEGSDEHINRATPSSYIRMETPQGR